MTEKKATAPMPRFVDAFHVEVDAQDSEEFRLLWNESISTGYLFVRTEQPPPLGTRVNVLVATPVGPLIFGGFVVQVLQDAIAHSPGQAPGVDLVLSDLNPEETKSMRRSIEGVAYRA